MKLLLVATNRESSPFPVAPIGALCIAAVARATGHDVKLLDLGFAFSPQRTLQKALVTGAPEAVAFSIRNLDNCSMLAPRSYFDEVRELAETVRCSFDGPLILGGSGFSVSPCGWMRRLDADCGVIGEGERTFAELLHTFESGGKAWRVDGVTTRKLDEIVSAPDAALIEDLDSIPSPYLTGVMSPVEGGAYLETYRGCPHRCGYCFEGKGYGRIRSFSRERIAAEIEAVAASSQIRTFSFIDPVFNLTGERLSWLADMLEPHAAAGTRLHTIEVDIEKIDDAAARELRRGGVASVETGPQTVGEAALAVCRRTFDEKRFAQGVGACRRAGISVECDLIVGLPGDDAHSFLAGLRFAIGLDPGMVQSSTLHVLPGTDLWARAPELGLSFDPEPPHEIMATPDVGYRDLRRAEVLAASVQASYRARV